MQSSRYEIRWQLCLHVTAGLEHAQSPGATQSRFLHGSQVRHLQSQSARWRRALLPSSSCKFTGFGLLIGRSGLVATRADTCTLIISVHVSKVPENE